jgi:uncharacterized repeat protein (TIGR01451 family)
VGENLTYTIKVTNLGPAPVVGPVQVTDRLPDGVDPEGYTSSDPATCTFDGRDVTCSIPGGFTVPGGANPDTTIRIVVEPQKSVEGENITNKAVVTDAQAGDANDEIVITTEVEAQATPGNTRRQYRERARERARDFFRDNRLFRQYQEDQEQQYDEAEEDLDSLDEETNGEETIGDDQYDDEGDNDDGPAVSATSGNGQAEASTPGAVARSGDPDEQAPLTSTPDNVVDEVPTSGPLPNTGGMSPLYWLVPLAGLLILAGLPVYRWAKRRE